MKKKLLLATSAVLAVALGVGTTLALFSDTATSTNNFTAGRLCITAERNDGDPVPGPMFYVTAAQGQTPGGIPGTLPTGVWAPGDTHTRTLTISNPTSCSTMGAWLTTIETTMHPGGYLPMADKLWVELYTPQGGGPDVKVAEGWLSTFLAGPVAIQYPDTSKIPVHLSANRHMKFKVHFDIGADNSYQDKTLVVDFKVNAVQMPNNP
ncbi:MAG TPA: TasA family protein [Symbiobacteriaceae bacterium]|nr:TasA family protein [Symbiobacteriaceae bacterium]